MLCLVQSLANVISVCTSALVRDRTAHGCDVKEYPPKSWRNDEHTVKPLVSHSVALALNFATTPAVLPHIRSTSGQPRWPVMVLTRGGARAARAKERATEPNIPCGILDLPPELIEGVFGHLTGRRSRYTLLLVRKVCRAFREHSLVAFGATFFEHLCAMLHPLSLTTLIEIASHPQLSKFVRKVTVSGEQFGGVMDLNGRDEEQNMIDLQTSVKHSGLDRMILTEVFGKLPNLEMVRIDNRSFRIEPGVFDAALCGSRYIVPDPEQNEYDVHSAQRGLNRAFGVVFVSLCNAGLSGKVDIEMQVHVTALPSQNDDSFDPTSASWTKKLAAKVRFLELSGILAAPWTLNLLQSVPNLQTLQVYLTEELRLSHPDTGPFVWPHLQHLVLEDTVHDAHDLAIFFRAHRETLCDFRLQCVNLIAGSWRVPFQIMAEMPNLEHMDLFVLQEHTRLSQSGVSFDRFSGSEDFDVYNIRLHNNAAIRAALASLLHDFQTTFYRPSRNSTSYRVDFRLAKAVIEGRAEIRDGECNLLGED
jgi:hypothetical protein